MLRRAVAAMRRSIRAERADLRVLRRLEARAIRRRLRRHRAGVVKRLRSLLGIPPAAAAGDGGERERILDVLAAHPHGIGAQEIGNELGVDWRGIVPVIGAMVAEGAIDQIEQDFFQSGNVSGKC